MWGVDIFNKTLSSSNLFYPLSTSTNSSTLKQNCLEPSLYEAKSHGVPIYIGISADVAFIGDISFTSADIFCISAYIYWLIEDISAKKSHIS